MMREVMLIVHFIGLAMGLGTSFGFLFLGIAASKLEKEDAPKFMINSFALIKMGQIGLTLLVISGGYLMTLFWKILPSTPLLIAKLTLVIILIALIISISLAMKKARNGDFKNQKRTIQTLGRISLLTTIIIVILAVSVFH